MYFSASTGGFYDPDIHGSNIPVDAVEITAEDYAALLDAQSQGKIIKANSKGKPVAADPPLPSGNDAIKSQIAALEGTVTARRIREAVLGIDNGWIAGINQQIADLRAQLT